MAADVETLAGQNRGPEVLAVVVALLALSTVSIVLRLISRFGVVKKVGNDDYAIILAWVGNNRKLRFQSDGVLIAGSFLPLGYPSPSAMVRVSDWDATKSISNRSNTYL